MNKKIIAIIIASLVIIGIVVAIVVVSANRNKEVENNNQNNNENVENNNEENNEGGNNMENETKILVLYFSMSGNTQTVANLIHDTVGGDILRLETVQTYPSSYNELVDYAQDEQRANARPELKTEVNVDDYDVIFLGYPNWWGDMPMPLYTFLDQYDLSGKTIAPFITHGGSGLSGTPAKIKNAESNANVTEGLAISSSSVNSSQSTINSWLANLDY